MHTVLAHGWLTSCLGPYRMEAILQDLRYAVRTLLRNRAFSIIAIACLAVGIGANAAVFSIVNGVLLRDLPFPDSERIAAVYASSASRGIGSSGLPFADLEAVRATGAFEDIAGVARRNFSLSGTEISERLAGAAVTPNLFNLLGVQPVLGRNFLDAEAAPAGFEGIAIISDRLWHNRFGGAADILSQTIRVDGRELAVVGVMPRGFRFPEREDLWVPYAPADVSSRGTRPLLGFAKLHQDGDVRAVQSRVSTVARELETSFPQSHRGWDIEVSRYRDFIVDPPERRLILVMYGCVLFLLLIAVTNVANLLLARAADRDREIALRTAIGASRRRVVQQLLTESLLLAVIGGGFGVLIALWGIDAFSSSIPEELIFWINFSLDRSVLLYTVSISLAAGLLFGLVPALQLSRPDLHHGLRDSGRAGDTRSRSRFRGALVGTEIALSLVLLVGAVLMVKTFLRLGTADPGFEQQNMQTLRIAMTDPRFDNSALRTTLVNRTVQALSVLPDVHGVVATTAIPADDGGTILTVAVEGSTVPADQLPYATVVGSSTGLFHTLQIPLLAGRDFTEAEVSDTMAPVAIVGEQLAGRLWPGEDPIGRRIHIGGRRWYRVIGLAPQLQYEEFGEENAQSVLQVHVPFAFYPYRQASLLVRGTNAVPSERMIREELRRVDPLVAVFDLMSMEQRRLFTTWEHRLFGVIFGSFGAIALVLALAGVYGVMAYSVSRRQREIGVRVSLGAAPADIMRLVLGRALLITVAGVTVGVIGALTLARLLIGILFGVSATDPVTFLGAPCLLAASALLASYLPARRAITIEPVVALRSD